MLTKKDKEFLLGLTDTTINEFHSYNLEELNQLRNIKKEYENCKDLLDNLYQLLNAKAKIYTDINGNEFINIDLNAKIKIPVDIPCGKVYISEKMKKIFMSDIINPEGINNIQEKINIIKNKKI